MQECPADAISEGEVYTIDPELCTDCGLCAQVCPTGAALPADE
jgi:NAD-dependent dihydropyrimidine dehydrogenase PreA subunit